MKHQISIKVNGNYYETGVNPWTTLNELLRENLNLTGTKTGCGSGDCGACTVAVNGKAVSSCLTLAVDVKDMEITTIEGLAPTGEELHPIQQAFIKKGAIQCGFCTPGMEMSAFCLLEDNVSINSDKIKEAISGNLCRCTGYTKIVEAISDAASKIIKKRSKVKIS